MLARQEKGDNNNRIYPTDNAAKIFILKSIKKLYGLRLLVVINKKTENPCI